MLQKVLVVIGLVIFAAAAVWLLKDEIMGSEEQAPPIADARPAPSAEAPSRVSEPAPRPAPYDASDEAEAALAGSPRIPLPPLDQSDPFVREQLEPFALPEEWTDRPDLVRWLAVVSDNATRAEVPRPQVAFLKPEGAFRVIESEGRIYAHPENARRFDPYLARLEQIDPQSLADVLIGIGPLLDAAFAELGTPDKSPSASRQTLLEAIDVALAVPVSRKSPELVRPKVLYRYADPDLEALPPLEKQLLRLGPENLERLQRYLGRLRAALAD